MTDEQIRTAKDIEPYFNALRPTRFQNEAYSPARVSAERPPGPGEVQPTGWVQNSQATVIIDDAGITIEDGSLTLRDPSGEAVLTGSGFSGSWQRFIASGLYNNNFSRVLTPGVEVDPTTVPYWDSEIQSLMNLRPVAVADATAPGGYYIDMGATPATEPTLGSYLAIYQNPIPVVSGETYEMAATVKITASPARRVGFWIQVFWFDASGTDISNTYNYREWNADVTTWTNFVFLRATAPSNAASASVRILAQGVDGWTATAPRVRVAEVTSRRVTLTPGRSVVKTTAESIPNNSWTRIQAYQTTDFNQGGIDWSTHGLGVFTVQTPGFYHIQAIGGFDTNITGDRYVALVFANAATPGAIPANENRRMKVAGGGNAPIEINMIRYMNILDTVSLSVHQASGAALNLYYARFTMMRLG